MFWLVYSDVMMKSNFGCNVMSHHCEEYCTTKKYIWHSQARCCYSAVMMK